MHVADDPEKAVTALVQRGWKLTQQECGPREQRGLPSDWPGKKRRPPETEYYGHLLPGFAWTDRVLSLTL